MPRLLLAAAILAVGTTAARADPSRPEPDVSDAALHLCAGSLMPETEAAVTRSIARWREKGGPAPFTAALPPEPPAADASPAGYRSFVSCVLEMVAVLDRR